MPKSATGSPTQASPQPDPREMGESPPSERRRHGVAPTESTEVRWFVRGAGPPLEGARARSFIDSYHTEMLGEGVSVKSRTGHGEGIFVKVRNAVLAQVEIGGLLGTPETWARWELDLLPRTLAEVHVHKAITRRRGVEVAQLQVHAEEWWSVAVRVRGSELPCLPLEVESHLTRRLGDALCCSYAVWLGRHTNKGTLRGSISG